MQCVGDGLEALLAQQSARLRRKDACLALDFVQPSDERYGLPGDFAAVARDVPRRAYA